MSPSSFSIEITRLGWIDPAFALDDAPGDLCSHGDIRLEIGGQEIVPAGRDDWYTISTSTLALLRTLESDHSPEHPVANHLIFHCGMLEMLGCPIGVDWSVTHLDGDRVRLSDVVSCYDLSVGEVCFPEADVELPEREYRRQVCGFAQKATEPFEGTTKTPADDYDRNLYEQFWLEYHERLQRNRLRLTGARRRFE